MIRNFLILLILISTLEATGSVVVIQPRLTEQNYRTMESFRSALQPYFSAAGKQRNSSEDQLIVLPEYLGTWLIAVDEPGWVFSARSLNGAMVRLIISHPFRFLKALFHGLFKDPFKTSFLGHVQRAVFIMSADKMKEAYELVFSDLADRFNFWIVAGSVLLPELVIEAGELVFKNSSAGDHYNLMNQSVVFNPKGEAILVSKKVYPVKEELKFLNSGSTAGLAVIPTSLGRLGVLVCADSWYPDCYEVLQEKEVEIIAVPSFVDPADRWESPWQGYDPAGKTPADVQSEDTKGIYLEKAMWSKYALYGRIGQTNARVGINSFLIGSFWGLTGGGQSNIIERGTIKKLAPDYLSKDLMIFELN